MDYNPLEIEKKWRKRWKEENKWLVNLDHAEHPFFNLMMFPYPSAEGMHVGNTYAFSGADIYGRYQKMKGFNVFEPMGFDSFGIHSENFAIKQNTHPRELIEKTTQNFRRQLDALGAMFDWDHSVTTSSPEYYKWTQWLFLQLYKKGLAYRAKAPVDWCPSCKTVLAREQVIQGRCERCKELVIQKELEQWFFKITDYAERLLSNLDWIDWSEEVKMMQRNWIGKSAGVLLKFEITNSKIQIEVFTTRPDTIYGATYLVLSPEHSALINLKSKIINHDEVEKYIEESRQKSMNERTREERDKTGVELKGIKAINPANSEEIPIWVADYVLTGYGTGAIMAVPAHDERDGEFAEKFGLPISDVPLADAEDVIEKVGGEKTVNYHLRDWLISRQRYWGPPIPILYCDDCGIVPVPEEDLPVILPYVQNFQPTGTEKSPLATIEGFVKTKCPTCGREARRETDVSDTFLDSSWYFFRYPSTDFNDRAFDEGRTRSWLPVDMYIGGKEHAVLHLMYARFITMVLFDLGFIDFEEPFKKFRAHGLITKDGAKMSKSRGNVVNPDEYFEAYGADAMRLYLMFIGPFEQGGDWQDQGIRGVDRFLKKVWALADKHEARSTKSETNSNDQNSKLETLRHKIIKKVTEDLENLQYNTAIAALMEFTNEILKQKSVVSRQSSVVSLLKLLAPFAPFITEELWHKMGYQDSVHAQKWPTFDISKIQEDIIQMAVQINGKVRGEIEVGAEAGEEEIKDKAVEAFRGRLEGKEPKNIIVVPGRLVNIVI